MQKKSLFYSFGKTGFQSKGLVELYKNSLEVQQLASVQSDPSFQEYFQNLLISAFNLKILSARDMHLYQGMIEEICARCKGGTRNTFVLTLAIQFLRIECYELWFWRIFRQQFTEMCKVE